MNCPVCKRSLAPTLSICFACGAMVNDSVREELQTKIGIGQPKTESRPILSKALTMEPKNEADAPQSVSPVPVKREIARPTPPLKRDTNRLNGPKTSPTLVEFQTKNAAVPDWRLQLQNTVRQRKGGSVQNTDAVADTSQARLVTQGANALKAEIVEEPKPQPATHENPKIAKALQRIDESRKNFLAEPTKRTKKQSTAAQPARNFPFNVVSPTKNVPQRTPEAKISMSEPPRPALVPTFKIEKKKFDTNKLPPIADEPQIAAVSEQLPEIEKPTPTVLPSVPEITIHVTKPDTGGLGLTDSDEIDDLAPISMRFNAALFDLIMGAFGSFALLSPIVIAGGNWFSIPGLAAFAGVWATVMFVYMTLAIGMYGKTVGMRMFGLELIDAEENDYPTFHQAAVHSAVFLLTLPFLGAGFLPMVFNEEQRGAHDLAAGTIIVAEF
jgi:uncharacterized RDD family membrane protein YckC